MSTPTRLDDTTTPAKSGLAAKIGSLLIALGLVFMLAGAVTWFQVRSQLVDEKITVASDARMFGGEQVDGPLDAYFQADIINKHALASTDGNTYGQLDKEDPRRAVVMNASFLRASLYTSVIAFGISLFAMGTGLLSLLNGLALRALARR